MAVYMVERNVKGLAPQALASVEAAVVSKAAVGSAERRHESWSERPSMWQFAHAIPPALVTLL